MIVWHEVFSIGNFLLVPVFKFHRPRVWIKILFQVVSLDKDSNYLNCCEFEGIQRSNHVAGCVFHKLFPILPSNRSVHSSNIKLKGIVIQSTNILPAFTVRTQDSFRSDFLRKKGGLLRLGK